MHCLELSKTMNLPRIVSIQNPYNLLNRSFELNLAEIAHREHVDLLAYSPLAFGTLTGKYLNAQHAENARCTLYKEFKRYFTESSILATEKYAALAESSNLTLSDMALAFVNRQAFLSSTIIGATNRQQLQQNINSQHICLDTETIKNIEKIHRLHTFPAP